MTQIDESTALSIQLRVHKKAGPYPAKTHAHKVKRQLAASDSSSSTGLIYLPGQNSEQYEDTDGYLLLPSIFPLSDFPLHTASIRPHDFGKTSTSL